MVAADQATLLVPGLAIGVIGWLTEHRHAVLFTPAQGAVVGDVVEQEAVVIAEPHRSFDPAKAIGQQFQLGVEQHQLLKAWIQAVSAG